MIRLRNFVKRTTGITMSALMVVSMMPASVYADEKSGNSSGMGRQASFTS